MTQSVTVFTSRVKRQTPFVFQACKINYMKKKPEAKPFAIKRGGLIRRARGLRRMKQEELATLLKMTRENVSNLESGRIERIDEWRCRVLRDELGLNPSELTEDKNMLGDDFLPEASFEARRVGRAWDKLPLPLRTYLLAQIDAFQAIQAKQPYMAHAVHEPAEPPQKSQVRRKAEP